MKLILIVFVVSFTINISASNNVNLTFTVKNRANKEIRIAVFQNYINRDTKTYTCVLDSAGIGIISFELDRPREVALRVERTNVFMFLTPGDDLEVSLDYKRGAQTIFYKGKGSSHCNFIAEMRRLFHDGSGGNDLIKTGISNTAYKEQINKKWEKRKSFYNDYKQSHQFSPAFEYYAQSLVDYTSIREHLMLYSSRKGDMKKPKEFYSFISPVYFNNDSILKYSQDYGSTISFYWSIFRDDVNTKSRKLSDLYQIFDTCYKGSTKNFMLARYLEAMYQDYPLFENDYAHFKENCKDEEVLQILHDTFKRYREAIPPKVLDATLFNMKGSEVSLRKFLESKKGKVLYIDVWSSWCGPCKTQMPDLIKLHHSMKDKGVEVLSLSVDSSPESWKTAIKKMNLPTENQFLLKHSFQSEFCKFYSINGIPRYFIINAQSRLVTAKAKRPTDKSLQKDLMKMLE